MSRLSEIYSARLGNAIIPQAMTMPFLVAAVNMEAVPAGHLKCMFISSADYRNFLLVPELNDLFTNASPIWRERGLLGTLFGINVYCDTYESGLIPRSSVAFVKAEVVQRNFG